MAQLRAIPGKGAGYGVLRHLGDEATKSALAVLPRPRVNFNYLGQFDQVLGSEGMFRPATEDAGPDFSERSVRPHALEVVGSVVDARLRMDWMFARTVHAPAMIERLADDFIGRLTTLVDHCVGSAAGGVTATDREDFAWDASDVEEIAAAVQRLRGGR
jgi:non-ribosomal peptide synthase protein (TIGR01720 family)